MVIHSTIRINTNKNILKRFQANSYAKIGVLSSTNKVVTKGENSTTLAYLAVLHHYGSIHTRLPARDIYYHNIISNKKIVQNAIPFARQQMANSFDINILLQILSKTVLDGIIIQAFRNGGFGKWAKNALSTIKRKGHSQILVDTGELMRAQTMEIIKSL
jgi:hypothetical protein